MYILTCFWHFVICYTPILQCIAIIVTNPTEQYETAIDDFSKCLAIQTEHLEPESRLVAETHYQIGLASCYAQKYEESLQHLRKAVEVINAKISEFQSDCSAEG